MNTSRCWLSAFIAKEPVLRSLEEDVLHRARQSKRTRRCSLSRQYRMHARVTRVIREVAGIYKGVMVYAAYMLGHIDCARRQCDRIGSEGYGCAGAESLFQAVLFEALR